MALFCAFCGSKMLSWKILGIKETALNKDLKSHLTPLVFDVDMKPLEKHADVHGAMNGIDLLKDVGMKRTQAQQNAKVDELMKLGIHRRTSEPHFSIIIIIYYSWNGGRAEAVCAGEND